MDLEHLTDQEKANLRERLKSLRKTATPVITVRSTHSPYGPTTSLFDGL